MRKLNLIMFQLYTLFLCRGAASHVTSCHVFVFIYFLIGQMTHYEPTSS